MKKLLTVILSIFVATSSVCSANVARVVVDRIEGSYAVVEFFKGETIKMQDILAEDLNSDVVEGMEIPVLAVKGKFYGNIQGVDCSGNENTYYQFRSDDNKVWWILTAAEIGHVPNKKDKYILYYTDNKTDENTTVCDCLPEWDCECYLYDDIFFYIEKI